MSQPRRRNSATERRKSTAKVLPGAPQALPKPNVADPLSEPTRHRRVWAAYLAAGLTRREFAAKLGTNYHTVNRWDSGAATISLDMLERASVLVGFSMDELCFGRRNDASSTIGAQVFREPPPREYQTQPKHEAELGKHGERADKEAPLSELEIRALLDAKGVDVATRAAFGEHAASPAGRYQSLTASYVEAWCSAYAQARNELEALHAGVNARAVTEAVSAGRSSVTSDALRGSFSRRSKP